MIPLSKIKPSKDNPRKSFDDKTITELAMSIKHDGLLQNLVLAKPKGKGKFYTLISGERRFRAMSLLVENGDWPKDEKISAQVKDGLNIADTHRLATIENIQRENLSPLEEANAVVALLQDDMKLDDVISQTGLSENTIKRRLALTNLCEEVKEALINGELTLSKAEAFTVGTHEQQKNLLSRDLNYYSVEEIKDFFTQDKANIALALFDKELYDGTFTSDLFGDDNTTFFDDMEQFWTLQNEAVQKLEADLSKQGFEPVEIVEGYFQSWNYRDAEEGEDSGAVIHVAHTGEVEIHKNLINRKLDKKAVELTEPKPRATYSKPVCEYIALHKSMAVQAALLDNPRIAKELAIVQMLSGHNGIKLNLHNCLSYFSEIENPPVYFDLLKTSITSALSTFDVIDDDNVLDFIQSYYGVGCDRERSVDYYEALKDLSDEDLDNLHSLLTILCFGQLSCDRLDTYEDSLFNRVAQDLKVDMASCWIPDEQFLKRRNLSQLKTIISESKLTRIFGNGDGYKKASLVKSLAERFKSIRTSKDIHEDEQAARDWLPEAFQFPAIDPDAKQVE